MSKFQSVSRHLHASGLQLRGLAYLHLIRAYASRKVDVGWIPTVLKDMEADKQTPTVEHLTLLLEAAANAGNVTTCRMVYGQFRRASGRVRNSIHGLMAATLIKAGHLDEAKALLSRLEESKGPFGTAVFNTAVRHFLHTGCLKEALLFIKEFPPDSIRHGSKVGRTTAYELSMTVFQRADDYDGVASTLRHMHAAGLFPGPGFLYALLSVLNDKAKNHTDAEMNRADTVLQHLEAFNALTALPAYNMAIAYYSRRGNVHKAEKLLKALAGAGLQPDVRSFMPILSAYADQGAAIRAEMCISSMQEYEVTPDIPVYTALIKAHMRASDLNAAWDTFKEIRDRGLVPDTAVWTLMMRVVSELDAGEAANKCEGFLAQMKKEGVAPNERTFAALIKACSKQPERALQHLQGMKADGLSPNVYCFAALIEAYVIAGNVTAALEHFENMLSEGIRPNAVIFNILLGGASAKRDLVALDQLYREMRAANVSPDSSTVFLLIHTCAKWSPDMHAAEQLYKEFVVNASRSHKNSQDVYHAMMNGYAQRGDVQACLNIRDHMFQAGYAEDRITRNIIMTAYGRVGEWKQVKDLWEVTLREGTVGQDSVVVALDVAGRYGTVEDVRMVVEQCAGLGIAFGENAYNSYMEALCRHEKFEHSIIVLYDMVGTGVEPTIKTYWTIVQPLTAAGRMLDVEHVRGFLERQYPHAVPPGLIVE
ncbi:hypothetical protein SpCBS45565_g02521 [Spizellomyces sp. 'palustris']|nr:hypothetical protein SpCBS45565_g02521 [Spizellomyces sp. 'palustris']